MLTVPMSDGLMMGWENAAILFFARSDTDLDLHEPPKKEKLETFPIRVSGAKTISRSWLENTFKNYGEIHSIELRTEENDMIACLYLHTYEAAKTAAKEMNGESVGGRKLNVELLQSQGGPQPTEAVVKHPAHGSQRAPAGATAASTQQQLQSFKLTNISLATSDATLQGKCGALEGFSSIRLVKVANGATNYAWVNYGAPHVVSAQKALDGMEVDGNRIKAGQPRACKSPLPPLVKEQSKAAQVTAPIPFSFKLPDTDIPPSSGASRVPSMFPPQSSSSRSPSPVPSLFNPVSCGLSLPSAHAMMPQRSPPKPNIQEVPPEPLQVQGNVKGSTHMDSPSKGEKERPTTKAEVAPQVHKQKTKSQVASSEPPKPMPFEQSGRSGELVPRVPALKHSQTQPLGAVGVTAREVQTGPPKETDVEHSESSKQNPFKQALAKRPSVSLPMKSASIEHTQKPAPEVTESINFSEALIKRILTSDYKSELSSISHVDIRGQEVDGATLTLSCRNQLSLHKAKDKVMALGQQVKTEIRDHTFTIHYCFLPCLADSDTIALLQAIEREDATEFTVVTTSRQFKLSECKQHLQSMLSEAETPLQLSCVTQFAENRLGYLWKVIHCHTKKEIHFDTDVNESINTSYIRHEATCSFEYKGHSYTVDFAQMTLIDRTCNEKHIVEKEPLWRYLTDDDFGYQPLSDDTSNKIERVFHNGAPGFVKMEGEDCVFDFISDPMNVQSIRRKERVFIQRDPPAVSKECVVTVRARGILSKLSTAEEKLRHTLRDRISSETIEIPPKMNTQVYRNLFLSMVRQYCVECTLDQRESLIYLKGTKQNTNGVKTCLQQAIIKILSENKAPHHHFPSEWDPQTDNIALCIVAEGGSEWTRIVELMRESMSNVKVKKIERIQNKALRQKYDFFKSRMEEATHGSGVNEKELFHGTRKTHPSQIYESDKGFDFRFGRESSMWGQGTYFAMKASYSDRNYAYIASDDSRVLLLAKVATGESKHMPNAENLKLPPLKPGKMIERYDTVHATTGGSDVYVVYDHEKAYPAYVITYHN